MKRRATVVLAIVLAFAVLAGFALAGQTRAVGPASVLAILAGRVELAHGDAEYVVASDGETVVSGDKVRTDQTGRAIVTFFDGSTLEIAPATELTVVAAAPLDGAVDLVIAQAIGRTVSSVHKLVDPRSRYEIRTPSITAVVRGTKFEVEVAADGSATERTTEGLVAVSSAGREVLVPAGSETRATPGTAPHAPAPIPALPTPTAAGPLPAVTTAAPTPMQAPGLPASPTPSASIDRSVPAPFIPIPTSRSASPLVTNAPVSTPPTTVPSTLVPLPTTSVAPLPSVTLAPLPTASIAPLPGVSIVPLRTAALPSASVPPATSPLPAPSLPLPISTIP